MKMETAMIAFAGVLVGAILQYYFTRLIENQRHVRDLRSQAFIDYLNCVSEQAQFRPKMGSNEQKEIFCRIANAKGRICLYGSKKVISAFSKFDELGSGMNTPEQKEAFTKMISLMRIDSGSKNCENNMEIQNVLLGIRE
jgi:hypothetical protein